MQDPFHALEVEDLVLEPRWQAGENLAAGPGWLPLLADSLPARAGLRNPEGQEHTSLEPVDVHLGVGPYLLLKVPAQVLKLVGLDVVWAVQLDLRDLPLSVQLGPIGPSPPLGLATARNAATAACGQRTAAGGRGRSTAAGAKQGRPPCFLLPTLTSRNPLVAPPGRRWCIGLQQWPPLRPE